MSMIPLFYVLLACWMVTMFAWLNREKQHAKERMEMLKLFRAESLNHYTAAEAKTPKKTNFMKDNISRAYEHLLGDDDD